MIRYVLRRVAWAGVVLVALTMSVYVLFGPVLSSRAKIDPARIVAGPRATRQAVDQTRRFLRLNRPWYVQYWVFVRRLVLGPSREDERRLCATGESCGSRVDRLGTTFIQQRAVGAVIRQALPVTLSLTVLAALIWLAISIPVGVLAALRTHSPFDRAAMTGVLWGQALPVYYFGLLALYFVAYLPNSDLFQSWFGTRVELFPIGGYAAFDPLDPWPWLQAMILPSATLALQYTALYVRLLRSNMLTIMEEDYVRTARAKGASPSRVVVRHALRNAILPIVTIAGMDVGLLLGGAVLTETTFGLPGVGQLTVRAAYSLDVPLTTGVVLVGGIAIVVMNLLVDLLYAVVDPRVRLT